MLCSYDSVPRGGSLVRANPPFGYRVETDSQQKHLLEYHF